MNRHEDLFLTTSQILRRAAESPTCFQAESPSQKDSALSLSVSRLAKWEEISLMLGASLAELRRINWRLNSLPSRG